MKQTARNNSFLKDVKKKMNEPIYKSTLEIVNSNLSGDAVTPENTEERARIYLQQFFCVPVDQIFPRR